MVLDELYLISKNTNNSFTDVSKLPIYKRRYFIKKIHDEFEEMEKQMNKIKK